MSKKEVGDIIKRLGNERDELLHVLQEIQKKNNYISEKDIIEISKQMDIPAAEIYGVVTFYSFFKLNKAAKYTVYICDGTACHVRGSTKLIDEVKKKLGNIEAGEITEDGLFSYQFVRCLGLCASAPLIKINEDIHPKLKRGDCSKIIDEYIAKENRTKSKKPSKNGGAN